MQCVVGGSTEFVFAVYVAYKRRRYPPTSIPRSELVSCRYCERVDEYMSHDDDPQGFTCTDGSYTPWRYAREDPSPNAVWMEVSMYQLHPDADYNCVQLVGEETRITTKRIPGSEVMEAGEDGQEDINGADSALQDLRRGRQQRDRGVCRGRCRTLSGAGM